MDNKIKNINHSLIPFHKIAIASIKKTKEMIYFAIQLNDAIQRKNILPKHFEKRLIIPEPNNKIHVELDWDKHPDIFTQTGGDALIYIASFSMIICKESYPEKIWVNQKDNPDVYAAQVTLKLVRDTMGHMSAQNENMAQPRWNINEKFRNVFEIKEIKFNFDAKNLNGKLFKFSHLGGMQNYLNVLNYLEQHSYNAISIKNTNY